MWLIRWTTQTLSNVFPINILACRAFLAFFCLWVISWCVIITNEAFSKIIRIYQTLKWTCCTLPLKCIKIWLISRALKTLSNIIFIDVSVLRTFYARLIDCTVQRIIFCTTYTIGEVTLIENCIFWAKLTTL